MNDCTEPHHFRTEYHGEATFYPTGADTVSDAGGFKFSIGSQSYLLTRQNVRDMANAAHRALGDPAVEMCGDCFGIEPTMPDDCMSDEAFRDECAMQAFVALLAAFPIIEDVHNDGNRKRIAYHFERLAVVARDAAETQVAERRRRNG